MKICRQLQDGGLLIRYACGACGAEERRRFDAHLETCGACTSKLQIVRAVIAAPPPEQRPADEERLQLLREEFRSAAAGAWAQERARSTLRGTAACQLAAWIPPPRRRRLAAPAALAAAAAAAVVFAVSVERGPAGPSDAQPLRTLNSAAAPADAVALINKKFLEELRPNRAGQGVDPGVRLGPEFLEVSPDRRRDVPRRP